MNIHLKEDDFNLALHRIDKDKSGEIEYPEFNTWYLNREEEYKKKYSSLANATKVVKEKWAANGVAAAAAEKTAKRFLIERSRIRSELDTVRVFRKTRPPNYGWCNDEWLVEHGLQHLTIDFDLKNNETLRRSLRVVEEKCEVPADLSPFGKKGLFGKKKVVNEGAGVIRAQSLAEQECRRWLGSASGKRAIVKQSWVLNSLMLTEGRKGGSKRSALDVFDVFEDDDIDIEDAYRSIRRKGIWLNKHNKEMLIEALIESCDGDRFNLEAWEKVRSVRSEATG